MMTSGLRIDNGIGVRPSAQTAAIAAHRGWLGSLVEHVSRSLRTAASEKSKKSLRHVETLSLGPKRSVFLIECDGQRFLLADGVSAPVALTQYFAAAAREERR